MAKSISIPAIKIDTIKVPIIGIAPLISQAWDPLVIQGLVDKQSGGATTPTKPPRDPEREYEATKYKLPDGRCGWPAGAFKNAMVRAGKVIGFAMTDSRGCFFTEGEGDPENPLVPIIGEPYMRTDMCRVEGKSMPRFRACFREWEAVLTIRYDVEVISAEQIVNLVNRAGETVGIGGWRPEKKGNFGRFQVVTE